VATTLNIPLFIALVLTPSYAPSLAVTSDAALVFYGGSMLVAALRGSGGCEVLAISNWLLPERRPDRVLGVRPVGRCRAPSEAGCQAKRELTKDDDPRGAVLPRPPQRCFVSKLARLGEAGARPRIVSRVVNDVVDYCCRAPSHQTPRGDPALTLVHQHWAFCPIGSLVGHEWELTGGVILSDLLARLVLPRLGLTA
jgi:hypothetical protein